MGDGVAKMETPAFMPGRTSIWHFEFVSAYGWALYDDAALTDSW
jgi:hypothetical protein